ncbi:MAG: rRNA maturation RNase YbeY [Actinomycetia bacterium]|nr:rRNA maturation RNase YbeY [Actinomycetota bacterium]MBU4482646.1 rRNA maturation RNase YbeY [Actinomycetota bacterium]MCG2791424.1 rRNA maturation RNase YbeY [Actinomycetes bacterium]
MKVTLINNQSKIKLDLDLIREVAAYISDKFDKDLKSELNIVFSDGKEIRKLNKKYRGIDRETDVLSFSYISDKDKISPGASTYTVGEIIICPEVAQSNILKQDENWNLNLEIILLIIHGILHIYNYDHEEEKNRIDMESIQDSLVSDTRRTFKL